MFEQHIEEYRYTKLPQTSEIEINCVINQEEITKQLISMKNGKAPGPDGISVELLKDFKMVLMVVTYTRKTV